MSVDLTFPWKFICHYSQMYLCVCVCLVYVVVMRPDRTDSNRTAIRARASYDGICRVEGITEQEGAFEHAWTC